MSQTFCDGQRVAAITGKLVEPLDIARACGVVGTYIDRDVDDTWYAELRTSDQRRVRQAVAWQATVPESNTDASRGGVSSISSGDQSLSYDSSVSDIDRMLHPLARRALDRLSFRRKSTLHVTPYLSEEPEQDFSYYEDGTNAFLHDVVRTGPEDDILWHAL